MRTSEEPSTASTLRAANPLKWFAPARGRRTLRELNVREIAAYGELLQKLDDVLRAVSAFPGKALEARSRERREGFAASLGAYEEFILVNASLVDFGVRSCANEILDAGTEVWSLEGKRLDLEKMKTQTSDAGLSGTRGSEFWPLAAEQAKCVDGVRALGKELRRMLEHRLSTAATA